MPPVPCPGCGAELEPSPFEGRVVSLLWWADERLHRVACSWAGEGRVRAVVARWLIPVHGALCGVVGRRLMRGGL